MSYMVVNLMICMVVNLKSCMVVKLMKSQWDIQYVSKMAGNPMSYTSIVLNLMNYLVVNEMRYMILNQMSYMMCDLGIFIGLIW